MKRKKGSKKGHKKEKKIKTIDQASAPGSINIEEIGLDQNDDSRNDSDMGSELPSADKPINISSVESDQLIGNSTGKAGPGRLKVKLKSSRVLEPQGSYSDIQTPSDTDKNNQQAALELNRTGLEMEDSTYSDGQTSEMKNRFAEKYSRKAGRIKIKSFKGSGLSSETVQDKNVNKLPYRDSRYNEKELNAALMVIKKTMKMDAAGPFNSPVDPVALWILDYFDIIDTPIDFGTICNDLERGNKYMNLEDVFKDVQFIWDNCYKYNNKGDYIVDIMKRVKKNFMKYWMAAGLYLDKPTNVDTTEIEDSTNPSVQIPVRISCTPKGRQRTRSGDMGIDLHKSDCLCAVCVVRRRRKERDLEMQMRTSNYSLPRQFRVEESSPINNNFREDAISSPEQSQETNGNPEEKIKIFEQRGSYHQLAKAVAMYDEIEQCMNTSGSSGTSQPSMHMPFDNGDRSVFNQHSVDQKLDLGFTAELGKHISKSTGPRRRRKTRVFG